MQPSVISQAHNLLFQCQKEVDEEETQYIHVLLFLVLLENTNCNEKSKHRNKAVLKKSVPNILVLLGICQRFRMK
jgi:hypothetical protein